MYFKSTHPRALRNTRNRVLNSQRSVLLVERPLFHDFWVVSIDFRWFLIVSRAKSNVIEVSRFPLCTSYLTPSSQVYETKEHLPPTTKPTSKCIVRLYLQLFQIYNSVRNFFQTSSAWKLAKLCVKKQPPSRERAQRASGWGANKTP